MTEGQTNIRPDMDMNSLAGESKCVSLSAFLECFNSALHQSHVFKVILLAHTGLHRPTVAH